MAIVFGTGTQVTFTFSDPVPLAQWQPPARAGVYAILVPNDAVRPRPFSVIYFGQAHNYSERGFPNQHHKSFAWITTAQGKPLHVATYDMPGSSEEQRCAVESALCSHYNPCCNG